MNYIFSTIYPNSKKYYIEFINSINSQTNKNFKLFLVLNGTNLTKNQKKIINSDYDIFRINSSWQKSRIEGLKSLLKKNPKLIFFADSDDILDKNRIKMSLKKIGRNDFLVNNCYLFQKNLKNKKVWLKKKSQKITLKQIDYKNFVGCSNTVVKGIALKKILKEINIKLTAFDWCMAKLLLLKNYKGIYINQSLTYYRQYNNNTSSLIRITKKKIKKDIKCKLENLRYFLNFGLKYEKKIKELEKKQKLLNNRNFINNIKKNFLRNNQYWWSLI
jgi:hypothetical protein